MSKSSGKFLTVSVLEEQGLDPLAYRYFCLNSHYRKNLVYSDEAVENARQSLAELGLDELLDTAETGGGA